MILRLGPHGITVTRENLRREGLKGQALFEEHIIRIDDELEGAQLRETLIHEVLHFAADAVDCDLAEHHVKPMAIFVTQMLGGMLNTSTLEAECKT